ncbi:MAG TPA: DNA internalization-related competence protein ComEC/Rec2 [Nevskiaceae bacterium]|nr:DNA internalization-related competence protein ComEC/Rec2 [Nevskiaceae bacterium]
MNPAPRLALAVALGIGGVHALPELPGLAWLVALAALALPGGRGALERRGLALGVLACTLAAQQALGERLPVSRHGETLSVRGMVSSLPEAGPLEDGTRTWRFRFAPADSGLPPALRVSWYRSSETVRGGDCWVFDLRLRTPRGSHNPAGFDYEAWLLREGLGATASVRAAQRCGEDQGGYWLTLRQHWRERFERSLPDHPGLPWLLALTIGDDSSLRDADWEALRLTGTSHLVAISGFNVGLVAGLAFWLGRALWSLWPRALLWLPAPRAGLLAAALCGLLYALLAGWETPVQRAALMLLVVTAAAWMNRLQQGRQVLSLALLLVLLHDPLQWTSPGLWLSFVAVAALYWLGHRGRAAEPGWRLLLRLQLGLSLLLLPLGLLFFHGQSPWSPLVNLLAVPLLAVLTPLVLLAALLSTLPVAGSTLLLGVCASALALLGEGVRQLAASLPMPWLPLALPPSALLLLGFALLLLWLPRGLPLQPLGATLGLFALLLPVLGSPRPPPGEVWLTLMDVGQGLAVHLRTQRHDLLYDAGPAYEEGFDAGESVVLPMLLASGTRRLDRVLLSHGDHDHAGGLPAVRARLPVGEVIGTPAGRPCRAGEQWTWDGVRFQILHPADPAGWGDNDASCVLKVEGQGHRLLLAGDIERRAEAALVALDPDALAADLLVAPHHGSRTSSTPALVAAVAPARVLYGAGWRHHYGHPRPEVLARWEAAGARNHVSGWSGALDWRPGADRAGTLSASREQSRRWWQAPPGP